MMHGRDTVRMPAARRMGLVVLLVAGMPAGCSDRMLDTGPIAYVTGGGPPPDGPSPIRAMSGDDPTYPNLATVPARPTDVPTPQQRQADLEALERSRSANRSAAEEVRRDPRLPVEPLAVPPPPDITPGRP